MPPIPVSPRRALTIDGTPVHAFDQSRPRRAETPPEPRVRLWADMFGITVRSAS